MAILWMCANIVSNFSETSRVLATANYFSVATRSSTQTQAKPSLVVLLVLQAAEDKGSCRCRDCSQVQVLLKQSDQAPPDF